MRQNAQVLLARKDGVPIAAMLTLYHRTTVVYKYGCSDERYHRFAGMPFLFWKLIDESRGAGATQIDFGRTDLDNKGLVAFKDRFGGTRQILTYFRSANSKEKSMIASGLPTARRLFSVLPDVVWPWVGRFVYRHIG
jgi:lipid II:glycine glycyltransferase (peptidoglycan interpeptide bridge formation enzyme)